jgi:hypothetical protein
MNLRSDSQPTTNEGGGHDLTQLSLAVEPMLESCRSGSAAHVRREAVDALHGAVLTHEARLIEIEDFPGMADNRDYLIAACDVLHGRKVTGYLLALLDDQDGSDMIYPGTTRSIALKAWRECPDEIVSNLKGDLQRLAKVQNHLAELEKAG